MPTDTGPTTSEPDPARRVQPWVAVLLTFGCTGLGHLYAGRERRGLAFFLLSLLFVPAAALAAVLPPSRGALVLLVGAIFLAVGTGLAAVVDAARSARTAPVRGSERVLWHPSLVALFLAVGVAFPLGAALVVRTWCLEAFRVASGSMEPTFPGGDRILVDKRAYIGGTPRRGDVVVFRLPSEGGRAYIKRIVGLPGERVALSQGHVRIDDRALPRSAAPDVGPGVSWEGEGRERYLVRIDPSAPPVEDMAERLLGPDQFFLLGDHRTASLDSRTLGPVRLDDIVGPATYVVWPPARFGPIRARGGR